MPPGLENKSDFPEPKPQQWLTEEQAQALKEFVNSGNGFYSLHNNSHVSLSSKTYREVQGGAYIGHPRCVLSRCVLLIVPIQSHRGSAISS